MAFVDTFQLGNGWIWGTSVLSGAQSAAELVAAPAAGANIQIAGWILAADATANSLSLQDEDANIVAQVYMAVDREHTFMLPVELLKAVGGINLATAKALDITTVGGTVTFVAVLYRVVTR